MSYFKNAMKLFVVHDKVLFYRDFCNNIDTGIIYRPLRSRFMRALRRLHLRSSLPLFSVWYTNDFRAAGTRSESIILFDSILTIPAANYLKKKYPSIRIIYWHWNHIENEKVQKNKLDDTVEQWSFDRADCRKYGLKFNTQFYFPEFGNSRQIIERDFFFIGVEKRRKEQIERCIQLIDDADLTRQFITIGNTRKEQLEKSLSYSQVLELISSSRCVVDIVSDVQQGLTLRPLEALFLQKKLLTNFPQIKDYDFYRPNNIFLIGEDNPSSLREFLSLPYDKTANKYIRHYSFAQWLKRFQ